MISNVTATSADFDGVYTHYSRMTAAQEDAWLDEKALQLPRQTTRTRKPAARRAGSYSRKVNRDAAQIYGGMLAGVKRSNQIPVDGMAPTAPRMLHQADEGGVA